jgi:hypothetical protein
MSDVCQEETSKACSPWRAALAQFAAVTRVKERPGFPIANDLTK